MRPLIRSLFLLSLAASPLAVAAAPAQAATAANAMVSSTAADSTSVESGASAARFRSQVQALESTLTEVRRELAQIRDQEDARARVIGDPNDHPLWP